MGPAGVRALGTWVPCPYRASESSGLQVRERDQGGLAGPQQRAAHPGWGHRSGDHILTHIREAPSSHELSVSP